jgi:riboflavin biosynthesis pyrimidine reductase
MRKLLVLAVLAIVAATSGVAIAEAAAPDPVIGTWQLNVSKSKFTPGPASKSQTRTYSQSAQGITVTIKTVGADGKEDTVQSTYQLDGKDYPVTGADYDSLSAKRVDSNTAEFTLKKAGKAVGTISRTVSKDGKTLTVKSKGTTAKGEKSESVQVFDKQ